MNAPDQKHKQKQSAKDNGLSRLVGLLDRLPESWMVPFAVLILVVQILSIVGIFVVQDLRLSLEQKRKQQEVQSMQLEQYPE